MTTTVLDLDTPTSTTPRPSRAPWAVAAGALAVAALAILAPPRTEATTARRVATPASTVLVQIYGDPASTTGLMWAAGDTAMPVPVGEPVTVAGLRRVIVVVDTGEAGRWVGCILTVDGVKEAEFVNGPDGRTACVYADGFPFPGSMSRRTRH